MVARAFEKINLSAKGLLNCVRKTFTGISEPSSGNQGNRKKISLTNCLMSALAMFKMKMPSLLQFDKSLEDDTIKENLKNLFGIDHVPCDTYMRERLDVVDPKELRKPFTSIFSLMQKGKVLEKYVFLNDKYLLLSDGTGEYSSGKICCKNCCIKKHGNNTKTYYHQALGAVVAHPDLKEVIPICPEPITKEDGSEKNDCERNATERLLKDFRREHPHLPVILAEDALAANGPHLKLLHELKISYITVVKPKGNKSLFEWLNGVERERFTFIDKDQTTHTFEYVNKVPLNDAHNDLEVNFLEYWAVDKNGKTYHNTWVTDIEIIKENAFQIARGGRARWKVENETFNTLKNQGYHFKHNYGHGKENLNTIFMMLMMLTFLIDQCEQICCGLFQKAWDKLGSKKALWERLRAFFTTYIIPSWKSLYQAIIDGNERDVPVLDTS